MCVCVIAHICFCETIQMCRRMYRYCIGSMCGLCECAELNCFYLTLFGSRCSPSHTVCGSMSLQKLRCLPLLRLSRSFIFFSLVMFYAENSEVCNFYVVIEILECSNCYLNNWLTGINVFITFIPLLFVNCLVKIKLSGYSLVCFLKSHKLNTFEFSIAVTLVNVKLTDYKCKLIFN